MTTLQTNASEHAVADAIVRTAGAINPSGNPTFNKVTIDSLTRQANELITDKKSDAYLRAIIAINRARSRNASGPLSD